MMTILVIDDDPAIREIFTAFLKRHGHTVYAAPGGREGLELLRTLQPDLIVLDIMMMPMDGWETLSAIKRDPATRAIPVTMFSGKQPDPEEICRYGTWIEDYLVKPLDFHRFSDILTDIIRRSSDWEKEREILKCVVPDHDLIDEYYGTRKIVYLLEKFLPLLETAPQQVRLIIQHQKNHISEMEVSMNLREFLPAGKVKS